MHNPIDIEGRFQSLRSFLAYPASARQRLLEIDKFLDWLGDDYAQCESYLLELAQHLPELINGLSASGNSPEPLRALAEKLFHLQAQLPAFAAISDLNEAIKKMQHRAAGLYACAGDLQTSLTLLDDRFATHPPVWLAEISNGHHRQPLAILQHARELAKSHHPQIIDFINELIANCFPAETRDANGIVVPVIERGLFNSTTDAHEGSLRRLSIKILGSASGGLDEIDAGVRVIGAQSSAASMLKAPIAAARRLLSETYSHLSKKCFSGKITFDAAHACHEGNSANLAIAALFYCAILRYTGQRRQFRLASNVAVTGDVDENGAVLPVDDDTLDAKVKAVFFSWAECLVVPKQQLHEAEAAAGALTQTYPHRQLTIIGVRHLREIFYDRRLTERQRATIAGHVARKAWRKKFTVGGLAAILILISIIGKLIYGPFDKNPVIAEFAGESLLIKNKSGEIVVNITVGPATVRRANSVGNDNELWGLHYVTFFDVDGDGMNEVFWVQWNDEKTAQPSKICCKSVLEDTLRWSIALRRALDFPRKPDAKSDYFYPSHIAAGDFDGDGGGELLVSSTQDFFPALVLRLEAKTGKELGCYVHVGQIGSMKLVDLDNDGITEVLLCGVNNAFRKACLVVLDPRFISGHSPLAGNYVLTGYPAGLEKTYILIPRTIVGEVFSEDSKNNSAQAIFLQQASRNFFLLIRDASSRNPPLSAKQLYLYGYFGFDLQVQSFGTHDDYDLTAEKLFREGRISRMPDYAYFEEYKKKMLYWDGEGWQNEPVMNRHYVEAMRK